MNKRKIILPMILLLILLNGCVNNVPIAMIKAPKTVTLGSYVVLEAYGYDVENTSLHAMWSFAEKPEGSQTEIVHDHDSLYRFLPDKEGVYVVRLVVYDGKAESKEALTSILAVSSVEPRPVINSFGDNYPIGEPIILDGSMSRVKADAVPQYTWRLAVKPEGSQASISSIHESKTTLIPDLLGMYRVSLTVSDGVRSKTISKDIIIATEILWTNCISTADIINLLWKTNAETVSTIEYGSDISYGHQLTDIDSWGKEHTATIRQLQPNTQYYFKLTTEDRSGCRLYYTCIFSTASEGTESLGEISTSYCSSASTDRI